MIRVRRQLITTAGGGLRFGPLKSVAGRRDVPLPAVAVPDLTQHLNQRVQDGDDALIFTSPGGTALR
jgi:hypothetical protein